MPETPSSPTEVDHVGKRPRKVQRYSPDRLLRRPVKLEGGVTVSAERHKGRIVVRVESPGEER